MSKPMDKRRQAIFDKSGGKCWYCGVDLPEKGWHEDHFHPIFRKLKFTRGKVTSTNDSHRNHLDTEENKVPSCAPCNLFKSTFDIEYMRSEIEAQYERIRSKSPGFRMLERMGMMKPSTKKVVFWFEGQGIKMPTLNQVNGISDEAAKIEWKVDHDDGCFYTEVKNRVVTLRAIHTDSGAKWLVIATAGDWDQERTELSMTYQQEAKLNAAQWALDLGRSE